MAKYKNIILSKGRSDSIITHELLDDYIVLVPKSEIKEYEKRIDKKRLKSIPDSYNGLGEVRNYVLDNFRNRIILMWDDDISHMANMMHIKARKITDKDIIKQATDNLVQNALDSGAKLFSYNQTWDVRKYEHTKPFKLNSWVGTMVGVIGKQLRWTQHNKLKVDIDYSLMHLQENRIIWKDQRFSLVNKRDSNKGGNTEFRNQEQINKELRFLKLKWGKYININESKFKYRISIKVKRTQDFQL